MSLKDWLMKKFTPKEGEEDTTSKKIGRGTIKTYDLATTEEGKYILKLALSLAVTQYFRLKIDPYAQAAGAKLDKTWEYIDIRFQQLEEYMTKIKDFVSDIKGKYNKTVDNMVDSLIALGNKNYKEFVENRQETTKKKVEDTIIITTKRETVETVGHPKFFPHFDTNEKYQFMFSDAVNILFWGIFGALAFRSSRTYIQRKLEERRMRKILDKYFKKKFGMPVEVWLEKNLEPVTVRFQLKIKSLEKQIEKRNDEISNLISQFSDRQARTDKIINIFLSLQSTGRMNPEIAKRIQDLLANRQADIQQLEKALKEIENLALSAAVSLKDATTEAAHETMVITEDSLK